MVKLLNPPIELLEEIAADEHTAAVLVDCSSSMSNHLLCSSGLRPTRRH